MFKARVAIIFTILFSFGFALSLFVASPADAAIITPGFQEEVVANGFILPTAMAFANDGTIFVAEKSGTVKRIVNGVRMLTPVITLTDVNTFGDRGLIGIAADPNFGVNGYLYLSYTYENTPGAFVSGSKTARVVRVTVINGIAEESSKLVLVGTIGGNATQPSCENYLVTVDCVPSDSPSHSAGGLRFGPDGKLYASFGDGADFSAVDPRALRAQNIDSLGGKVIRINPDGTAPTDNPFYNGDPTANRPKVYALGVRNSFRFNFNQVNGKLYAGDVGWSSFEEVNAIESGKNYGWPCREGLSATTYNCTPSSTATNPVYTYPHNVSGSGSISVGAFPSNGAYPSIYTNTLFIGDYAQNWIKMVNLSATGTLLSVEDLTTGMLFPVDLTAGPDGNIYYLDIGYASVNRITHTSGNRRPVVTLGATPTSGTLPLTVTFSSVGTYDPDADALTYLWNFGDGFTSTAPNPSHLYSTSGSYTAALTVTDSNGAVATKNIVITAGNRAPQAQILSPASGALYSPLELITLSATATDFEDGILPPSAYSWQVLLHHNTHVHYVQSFVGVQNPTFIADNHNDPDVYMEIILTVTDSVGLTNVKSISMYMNNGLGGANLFANPSVEIPSDGALSYLPIGWANGWFGTLDPVFSYPMGAGFDGDRAVSVRINSYTSGSAKWFPSPVYVTPGKTYTFSNLYTATVPTQVVAQYGRSDGTYQYQLLGTVPVATLPTPTTYAITIPAGTETMSVFHEINAVGTLTTDNYVLSLAGGDTTLPSGTIVSPASSTIASGTIPVSVNASDNIGVASVTLFVDGTPVGTPDTEAPYTLPWNTASSTNGVHALAARILDTSSNAFVTPSITITVTNASATPVNLFDNGNFEVASGTNPRSWQPGGSGTHTAVYSYPVPGITGNGIAITVTKYGPNDTGDARWVHAPIPVTSGIRYTYRTAYKATTISDVLGRYRFANGTEHYFGLIKEIPGTSNWTYVENSFVPPVGAIDVTFGHAGQ